MAAPTATQILNVRREAIGASTDTTTLPDADITYYWENDGSGNVLLTAALCCDMLANAAAKHFAWSGDGQSFHMNDRQKQYRESAAELRARYYGSGAITVTRSHDVGKDEGEYSP